MQFLTDAAKGLRTRNWHLASCCLLPVNSSAQNMKIHTEVNVEDKISGENKSQMKMRQQLLEPSLRVELPGKCCSIDSIEIRIS